MADPDPNIIPDQFYKATKAQRQKDTDWYTSQHDNIMGPFTKMVGNYEEHQSPPEQGNVTYRWRPLNNYSWERRQPGMDPGPEDSPFYFPGAKDYEGWTTTLANHNLDPLTKKAWLINPHEADYGTAKEYITRFNQSQRPGIAPYDQQATEQLAAFTREQQALKDVLSNSNLNDLRFFSQLGASLNNAALNGFNVKKVLGVMEKIPGWLGGMTPEQRKQIDTDLGPALDNYQKLVSTLTAMGNNVKWANTHLAGTPGTQESTGIGNNAVGAIMKAVKDSGIPLTGNIMDAVNEFAKGTIDVNTLAHSLPGSLAEQRNILHGMVKNFSDSGLNTPQGLIEAGNKAYLANKADGINPGDTEYSNAKPIQIGHGVLPEVTDDVIKNIPEAAGAKPQPTPDNSGTTVPGTQVPKNVSVPHKPTPEEAAATPHKPTPEEAGAMDKLLKAPPMSVPPPSFMLPPLSMTSPQSSQGNNPPSEGEVGSYADTLPTLAAQEHVDALERGQPFKWAADNQIYVRS